MACAPGMSRPECPSCGPQTFHGISVSSRPLHDGLLPRQVWLSRPDYGLSRSFMSGFICRSHPGDSLGIPRISMAAFQAYHRDRTAMLPRAANAFVFLPPPASASLSSRDPGRLVQTTATYRMFLKSWRGCERSDSLQGETFEESSGWMLELRWSGEAADVIVKCTGVAVYRAHQVQVPPTHPPAMHRLYKYSVQNGLSDPQRRSRGDPNASLPCQVLPLRAQQQEKCKRGVWDGPARA